MIKDRILREKARIQELLPGCTGMDIAFFSKEHNVRSTTIRIWAEQGALGYCNGRIIKVKPSTADDQEVIYNALKKLSVFRVGAVFSFDNRTFSSDWHHWEWKLIDINEQKEECVLLKNSQTSPDTQTMLLETLWTQWLNGNAVIERYIDAAK